MNPYLVLSDVVGAFVVLWFFITAEKERQSAVIWVVAAVIGYVATMMLAKSLCRYQLKMDAPTGIIVSTLAAIAVCFVLWLVLGNLLPKGGGRGPREPGALAWSMGHIVAFAVLGLLATVNHQSDFWAEMFFRFLLFILPAFCLCDGWRLKKPVTTLWVCALAAAVFWLPALAGLGKGVPKGDILMAMLVTGAIAAAVGGVSAWIAVTRE